MKTLPTLFLCLVALSLPPSGRAAEAKPKYGPHIQLLSQDHAYLRKNPAPDYWALSPYYLPQRDERACSLAAITMTVNGARSSAKLKLGSEDELATQESVLKKADDATWTDEMTSTTHGGIKGLEELARYAEKSLKGFGVSPKKIEIIRVEDTSAKSATAVRRALVENEKSDGDFLVANFDQFVFTQDTHVGHVAPIAAYDAARKRVLVLDPDRKWYEPYWVPEALFVESLATMDTSVNKKRGLVWIKIR
jgi:hypothetical protein